MKRNIGTKPALYPVPVIVVGAMNGDEPTWTLVAHAGIPSHSKIMVSLAGAHFINQHIKRAGVLSVNVVDESWLDRADFCGSVSGARESKADVFAWTAGEAGAPLIDDAKLSMECHVEDVYEIDHFENFVCSIVGTYADDSIVIEDGRVDVAALRPVLFEMPTYTYLATGEKIADCLSFARVCKAKDAMD
ncbi:flavin reductase family protein [Enorma burkinafasonensis]|uniref:flavin reductase family protein n=1 Tax=Enorma burkinafasonensis TaxID=2590867 RepID=UPI0026EA7255|nr:flavin reductase family protein [Enorma burkinafasonensis]MCI7730267.1 flavin reductase family protein [Enorma burkinafasonensis]